MLNLQRGDTVIEVLFSVAVFSFVAIGTMTIMNQSTGTIQRSLEMSLVRAQIDNQAEQLRFMNQAYLARTSTDQITPDQQGDPAERWRYIITQLATTQASVFGSQVSGGRCLLPSPGFQPFVVNPTTGSIANAIQVADSFAQVDGSTGRGLWVEAVLSPDTGAGSRFVDFHIRACWEAAGSSLPATMGTIVRLYEPAM